MKERRGSAWAFLIPVFATLLIVPVALYLGTAVWGTSSPDMRARSENSGPPEEAVAGASPPASPAANVQADVRIINFAYTPSRLSIRVGEEATFANVSESTHTVTMDDQPDSGDLGPGQVFRFRATQPGEFDYYCTIHPNLMRGTVTVTQ